ncbi:alpha/beta hydrolase [Hydrogenophaga sp. OTU3427]|uniref:alpha/beta hydrolase n=1 Tax=Hydrogenophaga sp. OTU3427 TaxID=3043856 RepID=UPI00313DC923
MVPGQDWRRLSADELERGYNARATVPDVDALLRDYRAQSTPMYALPCVRDIAYGPHPDERLDLFPVPGRRDAPLFVFVHGGYWRALAKEDSVFMARCFTERGIAVASLNYTLSPQAPLAEIVAQCRRGLGWLHAHGAAHGIDTSHIVLAGSSAGGHLAAAMLSPAALAAHGIAPGVVRGAVLVSGLFDLAPVQRTRPNDWLQLDEAGARALSPQHDLPAPGTRLCVAVAETDTGEFKRQSRDYAQACATHGCPTQSLEVAGRNHFDIILDWMDPDSALSQATWPLFAR